MEYKKAIYKPREVDLYATMAQLELHEAVIIPRALIQRCRMAASRMKKRNEAIYTVNETKEGTVITRML